MKPLDLTLLAVRRYAPHFRSIPRRKSWRSKSAIAKSTLAIVVCTAILTIHGPVAAVNIKLQTGEVVTGEIIAATQSILIVKKEKGGVRQLTRSTVDSIGLTTKDGQQLSGQLIGWAEGVYEIASGESVLRVRQYEVVESRPLKQPEVRTAEADVEPASGPDAQSPASAAEPESKNDQELLSANEATLAESAPKPAASAESARLTLDLDAPSVVDEGASPSPSSWSLQPPLSKPESAGQTLADADLPVPVEDPVTNIPPAHSGGWANQLAATRQELDTLRTKQSELQSQLNARTRESEASKNEVRKLQDAILQLETELSEQKAKAAGFAKLVEDQKGSLEAEREEAAAKASAIVAKAAATDKELKARTKALAQAERRNEELKEANQLLDARIAAQLKDSEASSAEGAQLQERLAELEERLQKRELDRVKAEQARIAAEKFLAEERAQSEAELAELASALKIAESDKAALSGDLKQALGRLEELETTHADLKSRLTSDDGKLTELQAERDALRATLVSVQDDAKRAAEQFKRAERDKAESENALVDERRRTLSWLTLAAEAGFPAAQTSLGYRYRHGTGVVQDDKQAVAWYKMAAAQGYPNGQNNLGYMYANGLGVEKDEAEAVHWYRLAAEQGYANAQSNLGYMLAKGIGVEQNFVEAADWFRVAAEQGHNFALTSLGVMYEQGYGVEKDSTRAAEYYSEAAKRGDQTAQQRLDELKDPSNAETATN